MPRKHKQVHRDAPSPAFVAFGDNSWYARWADGSWNSTGLGKELLWELQHTQGKVAFVALGSDDGRWFIKFEDGSTLWYGIGHLGQTFQRWPAAYLQFLDDGGFLVKYEDGSTQWEDPPTHLQKLSSKYHVDRMYSDGSDGWLATLAPSGWEYAQLPLSLAGCIPPTLHQNNIKFIALSPDGSSYFACINNMNWWSSPDSDFELLTNPAPTQMDPRDIYFTSYCNSISKWFQNWMSVFDTIEWLNEGSLDTSDIPTIRIVWHKQGWWSLDNRRLFCFNFQGSIPVGCTSAGCGSFRF